MTRVRACASAILPACICLVGISAPARAQQPAPPPIEQPMVTRSGIDLAALDRGVNPCDDFY